jgi:hypothetical protein
MVFLYLVTLKGDYWVFQGKTIDMEDYRENPNDYLWKALRSDLKQHINKEEI